MNRRQFLQFLSVCYGQFVVSSSYGSELDSADVLFLVPSDAAYEAHRQVFNKRFQQLPAVIAVCRTEVGIQRAVRAATEKDMPIAIKGGGHSFEGFSLNQGGMVIDLSPMKQMQLLANHNLQCDPGVVLREVYDFTLPQKRLLPAGSCGGVGIAGLALGGGYGLFTRQFGLTSDHLQRVRLIDGEGRVRDSNDDRELLWACRGAGNGHFGVVSQLEFNTHTAPDTLYHARIKFGLKSIEQTVELASLWGAVASALPQPAFSAFVVNGKTLTIVLTGSEDLNSPQYSNFLSTFKQKEPKSFSIKSNPLSVAVKTFFGAKGPLFFRNASGGFYRDYSQLGSSFAALLGRAWTQPGVILQINTFSPPASNVESSFAHRDHAFLLELQSYWEKPEQTEKYTKIMDSLQALVNQKGSIPHYANYPDLTIPNWQKAYYGEANLPRLLKLKSALDPKNRFQHAQSLRA